MDKISLLDSKMQLEYGRVNWHGIQLMKYADMKHIQIHRWIKPLDNQFHWHEWIKPQNKDELNLTTFGQWSLQVYMEMNKWLNKIWPLEWGKQIHELQINIMLRVQFWWNDVWHEHICACNLSCIRWYYNQFNVRFCTQSLGENCAIILEIQRK